MPTPSRDWDEVAEHYATADTSSELADAERHDEAAAAPMVTVSLRLPRSTMDEVRRQAEEQGIRPTQLLRELVESGLVDADDDGTLVSLSEALRAVRRAAVRTRSGRQEPEDPE